MQQYSLWHNKEKVWKLVHSSNIATCNSVISIHYATINATDLMPSKYQVAQHETMQQWFTMHATI